MKFSEQFSNTVVSLWKLHIALKYLSMLAKMFRFYVLDLGNMSVYSLVIFITIFLMIFDSLTFPEQSNQDLSSSLESSPSSECCSEDHSSPSEIKWEDTERN